MSGEPHAVQEAFAVYAPKATEAVRVPPGNKQTEVGMIPEDWSVKRLGELVAFRTGPFGSALHKSDYTTGGVPVINPMHIVAGKLVSTEMMTVKESAAEQLSDFRLRVDDIVIGRRGEMGRCAVVQEEQEGWLCGTGSLIIRCARLVSPEFLQRVLSSPAAISAIEDTSVGTTMINLNQGVLSELRVQLPPLSEQYAIAAALSDVDALISSLDRLIAKKRALKTAAMQQLLTGKQRLPGFRGKWGTRRLGEIFSITIGESKSKYIENGGAYLIVDMGAISREGRLAATKPTDYQGDFLKSGDLVMPKDDIGGGNIIGKVAFIGEDNRYILGDHVYALRVKLGKPLFFSYIINGNKINSALRKKVSGSAQLGLSKKSVEEQEIPFPSLDEQTAIANVLSDMDSEISALEARREKTRQIKQGMVQELLTGRTRLV